MAYQFINVEKKDCKATITFNRPEALNALNSAVLTELGEIVDDLYKDDDVKVVILTGAGKAFVAGADLKEMESLRGATARAFTVKGRDIFRRLELLPKPVIGAINGFALGGGSELALCCDFLIASEKAIFGLPETGLGVIPGFSGTQRLPRRIGVAKAKEWIFLGQNHTAQEAFEVGLVNKVVPPEKLMDEAHALADALLQKSSSAIALAKTAIHRGMETDLDSALEIETGLVVAGFGSPDMLEGFQAFSEKRKPKFS